MPLGKHPSGSLCILIISNWNIIFHKISLKASTTGPADPLPAFITNLIGLIDLQINISQNMIVYNRQLDLAFYNTSSFFGYLLKFIFSASALFPAVQYLSLLGEVTLY